MIIAGYLARLKARDIILTNQDGRLTVDAPHDGLTEDDRDTIRQWKDEILLYLSSVTSTAPIPRATVTSGVAEAVPEARNDGPPYPALRLPNCRRCGEPRRIHCTYQGRPGHWLAWCDSDSIECCGKADVVDEEVIRRVKVAS